MLHSLINVKDTKTDVIKRGDSCNLHHILAPSELLQNKTYRNDPKFSDRYDLGKQCTPRSNCS